MTVASAGLLICRSGPAGPEVLLAHPGGPFWHGRDLAAWAIPKGLPGPGETLEAAAMREFREETGLTAPRPQLALTPARSSGKTVYCWLARADLDLAGFHSGTFEMEWPPRSGRRTRFPEVDAVRYFTEPDAMLRIHAGQRPILVEAFACLRDGAA